MKVGGTSLTSFSASVVTDTAADEHRTLPSLWPLQCPGECKQFMTAYLKCLRQNKNENGKCRHLTKEYLNCRMEKWVWSLGSNDARLVSVVVADDHLPIGAALPAQRPDGEGRVGEPGPARRRRGTIGRLEDEQFK